MNWLRLESWTNMAYLIGAIILFVEGIWVTGALLLLRMVASYFYHYFEELLHELRHNPLQQSWFRDDLKFWARADSAMMLSLLLGIAIEVPFYQGVTSGFILLIAALLNNGDAAGKLLKAGAIRVVE